MAGKKRTRRRNSVKLKHAISSSGQVRHVLVRGTSKNPVPMIATRKKGTLAKLAKLLRGHFPSAKVRVQKVKI